MVFKKNRLNSVIILLQRIDCSDLQFNSLISLFVKNKLKGCTKVNKTFPFCQKFLLFLQSFCTLIILNLIKDIKMRFSPHLTSVMIWTRNIVFKQLETDTKNNNNT